MKSAMMDSHIKVLRSKYEHNKWLEELKEERGEDAVEYVTALTDHYKDMRYPCIIVHDKSFEEISAGGVIFKSDF